MTSSTLNFTSVCKTFGKTRAIEDLSLSMPATGIVGLIGRNGSGKTTLLNLAASMLLPTTGSISVLGEASPKLSDSTIASIGMVPHKPRFLEGFSCQQYLHLLSTFYDTWDASRVDRLMKEFALDSTQRIMALSEGQRQMLAIIVAVAHRPKILLMDEPMSNLDPHSRANTVQMLWDLILDDGVLIVISSHILNDVEKIADWITFLDKGKAKEHDSLDTIRQRFQRWEILDPSKRLNPAEGLPGVIRSSYQHQSWTLSLSQANDARVNQRRHELNGSLQVSHLSLEEIFPILNAGGNHDGC